MSDIRKAAEDLLEGVEAAIKAGDWKVDGACDLDLAIVRLRQALAQPEQGPVAWVYNGILHEFDPSEFATSEVKPLYTAPPKREWVGLTDEEIEKCKINGGLPHAINWRLSVKVMEAKLKEKNT